MHVRTVGILATLSLLLIVGASPSDAQPRGHIPLVGVLQPGDPPVAYLSAFRQGLRELGYVEGQTIRLEYRYAAWQWDRLPGLAAELVQHQPDVIVTNTTPGTLAARQATTTIPIVIAAAGDLVELGIVASLARPGGNITGLILGGLELEGKRLELLKDAVPTITHVAVLADPVSTGSPDYASAFAVEAQALGVRLHQVNAGTPAAIDAALATISTSGADALVIQDSAMFNAHRQRILEFARTHRLPTVCGVRAYAEAGCLMAYAPDLLEMFRRATVFVDKILKGAKPGDLPVERATKFELVINLKTTKALGLTIPPTVLFQADEVIR
jgi:putative tryptophan/tyrosine transport system substrate-binding protein